MRSHLSILFFGALICFNASSKSLKDAKTPIGHGAEFELLLKTGVAKLMIYFVQPPSESAKAVEMYFETGPISFFQQFHLGIVDGKMSVENGYVHSHQFQTRRLDKEYLKGFDGVQMNQFLISSVEDLKKHFVGTETVKVKAGTVEANHYRIVNGGHTVDFWIHHDAKPIGLVKVVSRGEKVHQNYSLGMTRLLTGVGRRIDPKQALPMDDKTRSFLPKPSQMTSMGLF